MSYEARRTPKLTSPRSLWGILLLLMMPTSATAQDALFVTPAGDVGVGTNSPSEPFHVQGADGTTKVLVEEASTSETRRDLLRVENNGTTRIALQDTSADGEEWQFAVNGGADAFVITKQGSGATEFVLYRADIGSSNAGDMVIIGDLFTGGGTCAAGCDQLFQMGAESIEEHADSMWRQSYLPAIGPTRPGESWNLTEKTSGLITELEKAHIYIEQLHERLKRLEERFGAEDSACR